MKFFILVSLVALSSSCALADIFNVRVGSVLDDEKIKRNIILFNDYNDAIRLENECDTDTTEVPAALLEGNNVIIPTCWEPARGDGVGYFRYTHQFSLKEFTFDESKIKFRSAKYDSKLNKLLN